MPHIAVRQFIRDVTVCQSACLGVSSFQRVCDEHQLLLMSSCILTLFLFVLFLFVTRGRNYIPTS